MFIYLEVQIFCTKIVRVVISFFLLVYFKLFYNRTIVVGTAARVIILCIGTYYNIGMSCKRGTCIWNFKRQTSLIKKKKMLLQRRHNYNITFIISKKTGFWPSVIYLVLNLVQLSANKSIMCRLYNVISIALWTEYYLNTRSRVVGYVSCLFLPRC